MELIDTIEEMKSEDYKERFKAEYHQALIRRKKLTNMLDNWVDGKLTFEPTCSFDLLSAQMSIMTSYIWILRERARIENIDL